MKYQKIVKGVYALSLFLLVTACNNTPRQEAGRDAAPESEVVQEETTRNEIYQGIMPVADDPEMEVKVLLTLRPDQTYTEHLEYANREGEVIFQEGIYSREGDVLILTYPDSSMTFYRQQADRLHILDQDRQPIVDRVRSYVLDKQPVEFAHPYPVP